MTALAAWICAALSIGLTIQSGCSRAYHRNAADNQVASILNEKVNDPRWALPKIDIEPDRESRFFNPDNPDCPPLTPDDPAANKILNCTSGIRGAKLWRCLPESAGWESPDWTAFFESSYEELTDSPTGLPTIENLSLAEAVELSLIHSREYQGQLENLYLAALSLTLERYQFEVRPIGFFGEPGSGLFYRHDPDFDSSIQLGTTHFGFSRLFPTGAQFVAELVNDTIWLLSGGTSTTTATNLAFSLVQPLARGAGREIVLENLTQSERDVLYAVRDFARFRKQFFVSTITGGQVAGLQRFLRGFEFLAGSSDAPSVGFFPVLLRLQQLRNRQYIVRTLEYIIEDLQAEGADDLDIARLESTLADTLGDLYADQRVFDDRLDQYKVQLGLPPEMDVTLDDTLLDSFEFVDPVLMDLESRLRDLGRRAREEQFTPEQAKTDLELLVLDALEAIELVNEDFERLDQMLPDSLDKLTEDGQQQLIKIMTEERERLIVVRNEISELARQINELDPDAALQGDEQEPLRDLGRQLLVLVRRLSVIQTIVRVELVPLQPFDMELQDSIVIAIENRLDLMNRRARVVDARRNLEITADQLEADVELIGTANVNTRPLLSNNRPLGFRSSESEYLLGLRFDTPVDRVAERNDFRASQIAFDQAKRGYFGAEDNVKLEVRQSVRTLKQLQDSIVQRQRRVQYTARELDLAESKTGAERGLSLNNALRTLNRAQDELIEVWLDYETTRLNLYRDLGTMEIDERGFWMDPFYQQMAGEVFE